MRRIVTWLVTGAALLLGAAAATPLAAQCMACVSSSACGPSSSRGSCSAECMGTICACSDNVCRPGITAAPAAAESPSRFAARGAAGEGPANAAAVFVRDCDGSVELLLYAADGRLIESRILLREPEVPSPARLAVAVEGG